MHQGMGLDRMNALGRHRSRIKLGNIFIEEHLNGLLASNSGYQNQCFFVWLIELQLWHGLCSRAFVPGIRSDLNEIIRRVDQALIGSLSRAYQIFLYSPIRLLMGTIISIKLIA